MNHHGIKFLLLSLSIIFHHSSLLAVTGGVPTSERVHSSIVNIVFEKTVCSGVVISPNVVLSAAHCFDKGKKPLLVAYIQGDVVTKECNKQNVVDYSLVPNAVKTKFGVHSPDLFIMKIENPLCEAKVAEVSADKLEPNDVVSFAGHSKWEYGHGVSTQIDVKLIAKDKVKEHVFVESSPLAINVTKKFLEFGMDDYLFGLPTEDQASACMGDSGGPVFTELDGEMYLHGVIGVLVSNEKIGARKCNFAYVQAFAPVAPYYEWITEQINLWK